MACQRELNAIKVLHIAEQANQAPTQNFRTSSLSQSPQNAPTLPSALTFHASSNAEK